MGLAVARVVLPRRSLNAVLPLLLACTQGPSPAGPDHEDPGAGPGGKADLWHGNQMIPLPFPSGHTVQISQGYHGYFTHHGDETYAVDFVAGEGTEIAAVRGGLVVEARGDSNQGCPTESCANMANFIIVDHGDGTFAHYYHLQWGGALVQVGDTVCRGQVIGLSGNTGMSTGPHLHLQITNVLGETIPLLFEELEAPQGVPGGGPVAGLRGVPFPGAEAISQNAPTFCAAEAWTSSCDADAFLHFGVRLTSDVPCSLAVLGEAYELRGVVYGGGGYVQVGQMTPSGVWQYECVPVDPVTRAFATTLAWDPATYPPGRSYFMVMAARYDPNVPGQTCAAYGGWYRSARISLVAP